MGDQASTSAPDEKKKRPRPPGKETTFFAGLLLDWANETHGRLLLMSMSLFFIGGVLTFGSWLTRDDDGHFHVWFSFFAMGAACLIAGLVAWVWKALKKGRKPL